VIGEFDIYGVYVPLLAVFGGVAFLFQLAVKRAFDALGIYRFVWHRPLFDLSIFVILLGAVTAIGIAMGAL
jgi:hypothetical protein